MLRELHIAGLGVLEDVDLELDPGLNVLTGETGAGKTMVTVGLALATGARASGSLVREGAGRARVEARFDAPPVPEALGWAEDGELVLARTIGADGKGSARVCGQIATVSTLARLGALLVEVHGQNQAQRLLAPGVQRAFLDRFAGDPHASTVAAYAEAHRRLVSVRARLAELAERSRERERELDLLAYQVREIEAARLREGELEELAVEESRLGQVERLLEATARAWAELGEEGAAADLLRSAAAGLREAAEADPGLGDLAGRAAGVAAEVVELVRDLRAYREGLQVDPARLAAVRERIAAIRALERKYGEGEAGILAYLERARSRMEELAGADDERRELGDELARLQGEAGRLAALVSAGRREAAPRLERALAAELRELGMEGAAVEVALVPLDEPGPGGAERVELRFSGGPGQPSLPLAKVASGGELSRTMLACRTVLADLDAVPTLVFDEVDAGIGGRAGFAVGRRLAALARARQVLVVTHLPQIAAFADRQIRISKRAGAATAEVLEGGERVAELSRMLAGLPGSDRAALHAEELLEEAARAKARAGAEGRARGGGRDVRGVGS
ncbi:MAG TPA: DNA repair protein RecN, partial [Actinomycetota bacterium]|nr:DNA repair protein RecN [Actinomycetota bacterium]